MVSVETLHLETPTGDIELIVGCSDHAPTPLNSQEVSSRPSSSMPAISAYPACNSHRLAHCRQ